MPQDISAPEIRTAAAVSASTLAKLECPLLDGGDACFPPDRPVDLTALTRDLAASLDRFTQATSDDPFSNPVMLLAVELSRWLDNGDLTYATLEQLVQRLEVVRRRRQRHIGLLCDRTMAHGVHAAPRDHP